MNCNKRPHNERVIGHTRLPWQQTAALAEGKRLEHRATVIPVGGENRRHLRRATRSFPVLNLVFLHFCIEWLRNIVVFDRFKVLFIFIICICTGFILFCVE